MSTLDPNETVVREIVQYINANVLSPGDDPIEASTPLLELGIIDSLAMVNLLTFVQARFGASVPDERVVPASFMTAQAIGTLVFELQSDSTDASEQTPQTAAIHLLQDTGITTRRYALGGSTLHALGVDGPAERPMWLLLPGLGNPASSWGPMLQSLVSEHESLAVDYIGFGLSQTQLERPTFADHTELLLRLIASEFPDRKLVVVGSSAGAMLACEIARALPQQVEALVVTGFGMIDDPETWWGKLQEMASSPKAFLEAAYHRPPPLSTGLEALLTDVLSKPAYRSFLDLKARERMPTIFDELDVPTLFVAGQSDRVIGESAVERAVQAVAGAKVEWLARCGHFAPSERPEELLFLIEAFLERQNSADTHACSSTTAAVLA